MKQKINTLLSVLLIVLLIVLPRYNIIRIFNNVANNSPIDHINLTTEEKTEDFEFFYNTIVNSMPMIDSIRETYGLDFCESKEYYLKAIKETKSDFEFYCVMSSVIKDIPSFHTELVFPDYDSYTRLNCYHLQEMLCRSDIKPLTDYWYSSLKDEFDQYQQIKIIEFKYLEGQYLFDEYYSSEEYSQYKGAYLESIDDIPVNEYIIDQLSMWDREYDTKRSVSYRTFLTFSGDDGKEVLLNLRTIDGKLVTCKAYVNYIAEFKSKYDYVFGYNEGTETSGSFYIVDENNDIGYLYLEYFDESAANILSERITEQKVIIDLRNNSGGLRKVISDNLHNKLFADDIVQSLEWYVPLSDANRYVTQGNFTVVSVVNQLFHNAVTYSPTNFKTNAISEFLEGHSEIKYKGNGQENKKVYFLIGRNTGSAADGYVSTIKENGFGKLVGTNTSGEGLGASFCACSLPNSGLVFIHMPCFAFNPDGTDNSVMGTSPDVYIEQTAESFYKQRELQSQGEDIFTYQNRLKWDNQLISAINEINAE